MRITTFLGLFAFLSAPAAILACFNDGPAAAPETNVAQAAKQGAPAPAAASKDDAIVDYVPKAGVSGNLSSIGSDTLNNLMTHWAEGMRKFYPAVRVQVEGKGSATAPPALIKGTAQLGPMSREMKAVEIDEFEKKFGYKPTAIRVAIDALAVYVHKDNPVEKLTLPQVDAIFSKTRKGGAAADITTWGQIGLKDDWATRPISIYGRNSASGTYGYFKDHALFKGDFKDSVKEQPGSGGVVQGVTGDKFSIGYSGIGYKTSGVKAIDIAEKDGKPFFAAEEKNVYSGEYPLSRFLYVYINREPGKKLDPLVYETIKYILSKQGQEQVRRDEFLPLTARVIVEELKKIEEEY